MIQGAQRDAYREPLYNILLFSHLGQNCPKNIWEQTNVSRTGDSSVPKICTSGEMKCHPKVFHPPGWDNIFAPSYRAKNGMTSWRFQYHDVTIGSVVRALCFVHTCKKRRYNRAFYEKREAQGPFIAHLITNSKQLSQKKGQPESQDSNKCMCTAIHQYVSVNIWSQGDFVKGEALPLPIFAPPWVKPLEYLAETTTGMAAFQVKLFVFEAVFDSFFPCLGSTQGRIW